MPGPYTHELNNRTTVKHFEKFLDGFQIDHRQQETYSHYLGTSKSENLISQCLCKSSPLPNHPPQDSGAVGLKGGQKSTSPRTPICAPRQVRQDSEPLSSWTSRTVRRPGSNPFKQQAAASTLQASNPLLAKPPFRGMQI